jgi:putative endonuclease
VLFGKNNSQADDIRGLGRKGQELCEKFLKKQGYKLLERNFLCKTGEIDLIMAAPDGAIIFIEVKTRTNENFAEAEGAITAAKKTRMTRAANFFVKKHKLQDFPLRFDAVIVIIGENGEPEIRHYQNAF